MKNEKVYIYYLSQTNKKHIYIGSTVTPLKRLNEHKQTGYNTLCDRKLFSRRNIEMNVIDTVKRDERHFWERFYMDLFRSWGFLLINSAEIVNVNRKERTEFRYINQR